MRLGDPFKGIDSYKLIKKTITNQVFRGDNTKLRPLQRDVFVPSGRVESPLNAYEIAIANPIRFIKKYINQATIDNAIKKNPNISRILKENGLECKYEIANAESIIDSHLLPTAKKAQEVYLNMGHSKNEQNYLHLTQAALLHDIGKVFIPSKILNKKGKLTPQERSIIELHNKLSAEILKTTDLDPKVTRLALEHHDYGKNIARNHENQAITIADVYSALREDRPYKKPISDILARTIMYDMATNQKTFDSRFINCLSS